MFGRANLRNSSKKWKANYCEKRSTLKREKNATRKRTFSVIVFAVTKNYSKNLL